MFQRKYVCINHKETFTFVVSKMNIMCANIYKMVYGMFYSSICGIIESKDNNGNLPFHLWHKQTSVTGNRRCSALTEGQIRAGQDSLFLTLLNEAE